MAVSMFSANSLFAGGIYFGCPIGGGCYVEGLCKIVWNSDPGSVNTNFSLSADGGTLIMDISVADLQQFYPQNLGQFNTQTMTFSTPNGWVADAAFNQQIGALNPVTIPAGSYPFIATPNNRYVVFVPQTPKN